MSHRVNILFNEQVWEALQKVPKGERSRLVNRAVTEWFRARKRADAARRMDDLSRQLAPVSTEQIVRWVREDRERRA